MGQMDVTNEVKPHTIYTHLKEYGSSLGISGDLSDFTSAYNSVPLEFTNDGSYDYVVFKDVFNDGGFKDISFSTCDMFDTLLNCEQKMDAVIHHKAVKMMTTRMILLMVTD